MAINREPQVFLFLSRILGKNIVGATGKALGRVYDFTAEFVEPYPIVTGLVFTSDKKKIPCPPLERCGGYGPNISVSVSSIKDLSVLHLREGEVLLKDALLDKQVVDTDGAKIRRVNDLHFLKTRHGLYLVHVDVGFRGLIRRVGLIRVFDAIFKALFDYKLPNHLIQWKFTQPLITGSLTVEYCAKPVEPDPSGRSGGYSGRA